MRSWLTINTVKLLRSKCQGRPSSATNMSCTLAIAWASAIPSRCSNRVGERLLTARITTTESAAKPMPGVADMAGRDWVGDRLAEMGATITRSKTEPPTRPLGGCGDQNDKPPKAAKRAGTVALERSEEI